MASITVGTTSELIYTSNEGTATNPDSVALRLVDGSGTVYIERTNSGQNAAASASTSFFIKDAEIYATDLVAGDRLNAIVASGTEVIRVTGPASGTFGS